MHERTPEEILIREIIAKIAVGPNRGKDITKQEAYRATKNLLKGDLDETQAALFLIGLRMKKESMLEYAGILKAMDETCEDIKVDLPNLVYLADPFDGCSRHAPISPFVPAVLAACDIPCLIQGVESVGPKYGITPHQVYAENSLTTNLTPTQVAEKLQDPSCGWGYLDQAQSHPKLFALNDFRDKIVKRTALTTLERVLMPIKAKKNDLIIGYVHSAYPKIYAAMSSHIGFDQTFIIKGLEGGICADLDKPMRSYNVEKNIISKKNVELTPTELMNLRVDCLTLLENKTPHLSTIAEQPNSTKYQQLISTCAFVISRHKDIPINRAVKLAENALDSGEAVNRFSNFN